MTTAILLVVGCGGGSGASGGPPAIRLQDRFETATVTGSPAAAEEIAPTVLSFDGDAQPSWKAGIDVDNLRVENGRLVGTTTDRFPIIDLERTTGLDNPDTLYSIEIRARVSKGANLGVLFDTADEPAFPTIVFAETLGPWSLVTPLIPGDDIQTYTIPASLALVTSFSNLPLNGAGMRHVLIRPSDEAGAEFEIESVRLIYRQEYLATIPSGVSWQGFADRYKEAVVARAPERVSYDLTLPAQPWLDLSVATVEQLPVKFRVTVAQGGRESVVAEKTLTTANQWQTMLVELDAFARRPVTLSLELESEQASALGFWGTPVVRNRGAPAPGRADAPRGVILFVADTLRTDHLSTYGYERETSPVLTRLAREGALARDDESQAIWTKVSVPSIHTSLYPRTHTVRRFLDRLPAAATTIAEVYREAGYATMASSGNGFVGRGTNLHQGYEAFDEAPAFGADVGPTPSKTARAQVDRLLPWLEAHKDVPFFVSIQVTDPHSPFPPYRPYDTRWGDAATRQAYDEGFAKLTAAVPGFFGVGPTGQPRRGDFEQAEVDPGPFLRQEKDWYDGSIAAMDVELGRIVETLERLGLEDDVLLVFMADHGEEFLEHGGSFHLQIYGEDAHVPLVLWAPGRIPAGTVVDETLQSIDVMPTMLELSGLPVPEAAQGRSFASLLNPPALASSGVAYAQGTWRPQPAFTEQLRDDNGPNPGPFAADAYAVVTDGWKLVHNVYRPEGSPLPEWELFDHAGDPLDQRNVAAANPDVVARLGRLIDDWVAFAEAEALPADESALDGLDPAELERLRSLGYIQ